ncbi:AMP-dependent synthetase/ligase [Streptomyces sp. NPDC002779]|uniref:AMP-dependent synthetase/ligase n=1 Tax=Streptomyces sp. NPDC002779 TaxID=3364664 RepID=UPI0036B7C46C
MTIPALLRRNAQRFPDGPALTAGLGPEAATLSWPQLRAETAALTRGLTALGLRRGDRMLISMSRRPEHWIADLAAVHIGALSSSTYDTTDTEELGALARHSGAAVLVLEGEEQVRRWQPVLDGLPGLRAVVVLDWNAARVGDPRFVSYPAVRGAAPPDDAAFEALTDSASPDDPMALVYTPGTTGAPRGVVLTHRNVIHQAFMHHRTAEDPERPRSVAHLPMAQAAGRVLGLYAPVCHAGHVTLCPGPEQLLPTLITVRPHTFFAVPRVWDRIAAAARERLGTLPEEQAAAVTQARRTTLEAFRLRSAGKEPPTVLTESLAQLDEHLLRPVRSAVGADELQQAHTGTAPLSTATLEFLASVGLPVHKVWGLTETAGAATVSTRGESGTGTVGRPGPGIEVTEAEDGELLVRGPVVCAGYLRADGSVEPATDAQGRLATGDIGSVDARGLVTVTDRKKNLFVTDSGRTVAPARIEAHLRAHPLIGQAVAIGDRRRYVTALLVLDEQTAPLWADEKGLDTHDLARLSRHPVVLAAVDAAVAEANTVLPPAEQVRRYRVLPGPWTTETGELTPELTLRRRAVGELHAATIESMYP